MWLISSGWAPPFGYRSGYIPERDIVARVGFSIPDPRRTEEMRERERRSTVCVYIHEVLPLQELRSALKNDAFQVIQAEDADKLDAEVWQRFTSDQGSSSVVTDDDALQEFQAALKHDPDLTAFR